MNRYVQILVLQSFHVLFLSLHDWVPLGSLNNLKGVRSVDPLRTRIYGTVLSVLPFALPLGFSLAHASAQRYPGWLLTWLRITYAILFAGELRAWWLPYLGPADPVRAARYRIRFAHTHTFMPERNGIAPDTLHVILHVGTLATLLLLATL